MTTQSCCSVPPRAFILVVAFLILFSNTSKLCSSEFTFGFSNDTTRVTKQGIYKNGTFIIGGLFAIHFESKTTSNSLGCSGRFNGRGFEEAKAMLFAIEEINNDRNLLPGITLGADIKDTCSCVDFAIRSSLDFSFIEKSVKTGICVRKINETLPETVAIIGPGSSDIAMAVSNLAGLFQVPVVDYSSTSRLLNNRIRFKYFFRTVSSDTLLSKAIVDLLAKFGWNFIHVLYSDTDYGRSAMETFEYVLKKTSHFAQICTASKASFTIHSSKEHLRNVVEEIKAEKRAKGVVLFTTVQDLELILDEFRRENMEDYVFISPDYYSGSIEQFDCSPEMLRRVIGIVPHTNKGLSIHNITEEFESSLFYDSLQSSHLQKEYENFLAKNTSFCHSLFVPYVIDAVYAVAHALHSMLNCSEGPISCRVKPERFSELNRNGKEFLKRLQSVRFKGLTRDPVMFDQYGDSVGTYDVNIVNPLTDHWVKVGAWSSNGLDFYDTFAGNVSFLDIDEEIFERVWGKVYNKTDVPSSVCGQKCRPGHWMRHEKDNQVCCWECVPCTRNFISHTPVNSSCLQCPPRYWPNDNHSSCKPIIPKTVTLSDPPGMIVTIVASLGSLTDIAVAMVFLWFGETHVVRSSSKLLSLVMLFGILVGYVTSFLLFVEKTEFLCRSVLYLFSISFSIVVGTLLTKTNRIHRIFSKKAMRNGTPPCLSDKWMLFFITGFVAIEMVICTIIVLTTPNGKLKEIIYSDISNNAFLQCKFYANNMTIWWIYNTGIVLVCTYQAYLTRKVPGSHNEARFIAFTMVTISMDVLVFFLSYHGTRGYYKDVVVSTFLLIAVTATLCCVFLPKVYIILWKPEKNIDQNPVRSMGTIETSDTEMSRKISHISQRSCTSYLSTSSSASAPNVAENSRLMLEAINDDIEQKSSQRKRKMSVYVKNGIRLDSMENMRDGRESGPVSMETVLHDDDHVVSTRDKVTRMLSKSVHFEDELQPSVILEEFDPSYLDDFVYSRRKSTI